MATLIAWLPFLAIAAAMAAMAATGCQVDEVTEHPCVVAGHDIGGALGTALIIVPFVAGPFVPFAIGTAVAWIVLWRRSRRARV